MSYAKVAPAPVRVHTIQFRILGTMHLPPDRGAAEFLNADDRPHLALTGCAMYASGIEHPPNEEDLRYESEFAAVPKDQVVWMVGGMAGRPDPNLPRDDREVHLVYADCVLAGRLSLRPNVRTSDFLIDATVRRPFQTLFDARVLRPREGSGSGRLRVVERLDAVVANLRIVGAICDLQPEAPDDGVLAEGESFRRSIRRTPE